MRSFALSVFLLGAFLLPLSLPVLAHEGEHATLSASSAVVRIHETSHSLQNIADRIDTRATILAQGGVDAGAARPLLEDARMTLAVADVLIASATQTAIPEQSVLREITARLIAAHASLMGALEVLKGADTAIDSTEVSVLEVQ